jgi:hypothetical protein
VRKSPPDYGGPSSFGPDSSQNDARGIVEESVAALSTTRLQQTFPILYPSRNILIHIKDF